MALEETKAATDYAEKWDIQSTFEDALTSLMVNHPDDPMGFLYDQIVNKAAPPTIDKIVGREVIDGQGYPTLEVEVWGFVYGKSEYLGRAAAPSCDFCSSDDSFVVLDNAASRFHGKGTRQAVSLVTSVLQPVMEHRQFFNQRELDSSISAADGTKNHKKVGANTTLATSAAIAIAASRVLRIPLYKHLAKTINDKSQLLIPRPIFPIFNIPNGPISRVFLLPTTSVSVEDQVRIIGEIYAHYESAMHCPIYNNGCFMLEASAMEDILAAVEIAVSGGGHTLGDDVFLGFRGSQEANKQFWLELFEQSQVVTYVEDPLLFDDTDGWSSILSAASDKIVVAMGKGLASRPERISSHLDCNAVVLRAPQVGTLSKVADSAAQIERSSKRCVLATSERETEDTWICDLAVAIGASYLQLGSLSKGENITKINRLLEIAREMESDNKD
ncbi:Enolase, N-terminal domain containing protein [Tritrichomonas foetus]|uniref:phosphopyruvate hydratase n=1 Tax=Tritrichomonas foetus TaxID=1144522 RepID=A0A1J4JEF6_9EUKA|nr:Enolase, N-terminal domain containing protein [Tritrichomonas foetus]|eukprot:OHS95644.1 Enolase, N-terminal domain containing protein [Tritrichomonas foetus]